MSALMIPTWIIPENEDHEWLDEGSSVFTSAFAPGLAQRQSYGGLRLKLSRLHTVRQEELGLLLSLLKDTRGRYRAVYSKVHYSNRGSMPTAELMSNNTFASGTTGWSVNTGVVTISVMNRVLRIHRDSIASDDTVRAPSATVVSGAAYVARAYVRKGRGVMAYRFRLGTTAGASDITADSADRTTQDLGQIAGVASGTAMHFSIFDESTGKAVSDFVDSWYASITRCALVNGGSQTGDALNVDGLPASTDGLLLPGDWISVGNEIKMVTAMLGSNSAGEGYLQFTPPLVRSPLDNDPVVITDPMGKFLASNFKILNKFSTTAEVSYDLEHIYE